MRKFDFMVFIGRFQPFHNGHLRVIREALVRGEHVIVILGSAHVPRSIRNPFSFAERRQMILEAISEPDRLTIIPVMDQPYNDDAWVQSIQASVNGVIEAHHRRSLREATVALIGHSRDASSYYLNLFPTWSSVDVPDLSGVNATAIRDEYFVDVARPNNFDNVPPAVATWLADFREGAEFCALVEERHFIESYRGAWAGAPYPPTFVTSDAVVIQSGHVLLVERRASPGKGLMALPGGFVGQHETVLRACLRELREETRLKVPEPVLTGSIAGEQVFDDPNRSSRGRTITHAFHFRLRPERRLPTVRGGDDARRAFWLPLAELDPLRVFEDHYFIIRHFVGQ